MTTDSASPKISNFFSLTPDSILAACEQSGFATTGWCCALNSLENRVYEVELEDRSRLVAKFYRPGRWDRAAIEEEHRLLDALAQAEIPVCCHQRFPDGASVHQTADGIFFTLFPRTGGRMPDELTLAEYERVGRLIGRIHNVSATLQVAHRPTISPQTYGAQCLATIIEKGNLSPGLRHQYIDAAEQLIAHGRSLFEGVPVLPIHGDCHRGNLLRRDELFFFLDFDDFGLGPAVQDMWLLLSGRPSDCPQEVDSLLRGYEQFRDFPHASLRLIEVLRGLRYIRYAAWICDRFDDPAFPRAFPYFGTDNYWQGQVSDLHEQLRLL